MFFNLTYVFFALFLLGKRPCLAETSAPTKSSREEVIGLNQEYESFFPVILSELETHAGRKNLQDNRLNQFLSKRDTRGYFNTPYPPYTRELTPEERKDGTRRIGRFFNKWIMTAINEKYGIFQKSWRKDGNNYVSSNNFTDSLDTDNKEPSLSDKLKTEISYRLRTDRTEVEFKNDLFNVIGKAYYQGQQEVTVKKYFDSLGLETFYYLRPGQDTGEQFAFEKSLPYYLKAKTSYGKERPGFEEAPISSAKFELLYHGNF